MGSVHGGALGLLATEIGALAGEAAMGSPIVATSLAVSYLRPVAGPIQLVASVASARGAPSIAIRAAAGGKQCLLAYVLGRKLARDPVVRSRGEDRTAASNLHSVSISPENNFPKSGVPFRDSMAVQIETSTNGGLEVRWNPSPSLEEFTSKNSRVLGVAGLLVDTGGTIVNSDGSGNLVARYATTSVFVTLGITGLAALRGAVRVVEVGRGHRIRFTEATLTDASGNTSGRGIAQFAMLLG
jgi:hypothetical protein